MQHIFSKDKVARRFGPGSFFSRVGRTEPAESDSIHIANEPDASAVDPESSTSHTAPDLEGLGDRDVDCGSELARSPVPALPIPDMGSSQAHAAL